jgi:hypothetical protein
MFELQNNHRTLSSYPNGDEAGTSSGHSNPEVNETEATNSTKEVNPTVPKKRNLSSNYDYVSKIIV